MFGYQMMAFTRIGGVGGADEPLLMERIAVIPGNGKGIDETISVLEQLSRTSSRVTEVVCDRGFSFAKPEDWAEPLRDLGIAQVLDMHDADRGARPHPHGYVMIDGWAHCPSTPAHLLRRERPTRFTVNTPREGCVR